MNTRIKQLPTELANQIAAGEVIERPASVVKELIENASDAGASSIEISLRHAGFNLIRLSDNGYGINQEDLPLAIAPHATSKISNIDELFSVETMGFRGEALASIASVSNFKLISRVSDANSAYALSYDKGHFGIEETVRTQGTTVEVGDLFYNTPVRKQFLKSPKTEWLASEMVVKRFALAHPNIAISLKHNEALMLSLPQEKSEYPSTQRIQKVMGKAFVDAMHEINIESNGIKLYGYVADPSYQRNQNDKLWIYVNKRMVKDKLLQHAVKMAYDETLLPGRYPCALLYLTVNPSLVDVNVHPTKHEVRFKEARLIHDLFVLTIRKTLGLDSAPSQANPSSYIPTYRIPNGSTKSASGTNNSAEINVQSSKLIPFTKDFFGLMTDTQDIWMVDGRFYYHQYILNSCEAFPLNSRPLLVPLTIQHDNLGALSELQLGKFLDLGIQITLSGLKHAIIRSQPIHLPQLDILKFVQDALDDKCELTLASMLYYDKTDIYHLAPHARESFIQFILETNKSAQSPKRMKILDNASCEALLS